MERAAPYFRFKKEPLAKHTIFLELVVTLAPPRVVVTHHLKPEAMLCPLAPHSAHPLQIHRSWPRGMATRIHRLVCDAAARDSALRSYQDRLASHAEEFTRHQFQIGLAAMSTPKATTRGRRNTMQWLTLPYHPLADRAMRACCADASSRPLTAIVGNLLGLAERVRLRLARALCTPHLSTLCMATRRAPKS